MQFNNIFIRVIMNTSKSIRIFGIILLLIGIAQLPYGYYIFLRLVITAIGIYMIFVCSSANSYGWAWVFGIVAILFNPLIPIHLEKDVWIFFDIIVAILLIISIFSVKIEE